MRRAIGSIESVKEVKFRKPPHRRCCDRLYLDWT